MFICHNKGHSVNTCSELTELKKQQEAKVTSISVIDETELVTESYPLIKVKGIVKGNTVDVLIDPGSMNNLLSQYIVEQL